jgi:hypothetical protein
MVRARSSIKVHERLDRAIWAFGEHEHSLIALDPSERSLTHRLAIRIEAEFPGWDVDCEYNRAGSVPKQLARLTLVNVAPNEPDAVTVFPDIIVHRRGSDGPNLLVVEAKKATSGTDAAYDRAKLKGYKEELGYRFAAFVVLPAGLRPGQPPEWI